MSAVFNTLVKKVAADLLESKMKGKNNKNKIGGGTALPPWEDVLKFGGKIPKNVASASVKKILANIGGQQIPVSKISGSPQGVMGQENGTTSMVVVKTEPIFQVIGDTGFSVSGVDFYPQGAVLPWLSSISKSFVEYQVLDIEFTYVPYVPTTTTGSVSIAWTGDYADSDPATMLAMLASEQSMIAPVYAGSEGGQALQQFGIPKGNVVGFKVPRYTYCEGGRPKTFRNLGETKFSAATVEMRNQYSPGRLLVAVSGMASNATVGYVFVRYKIKLLGSVKASGNA